MIDLKSLNTIVESSNSLLETDLVHAKSLKDFQSLLEIFKRTQEQVSFIKDQSQMLKQVIEKYKNLINSSIHQLSYYFKQITNIPTATVSNHLLQNNQKIKECLSKFIPLSIITQCKTTNITNHLPEKFKFEVYDELSPITKSKKYRTCCESFKELLSFIAKSLISLYNSNLSLNFSPNPELTSFDCRGQQDKKPPSSWLKEEKKTGIDESRKNIVSKVQKLLNRGSLSKSEAKKVILNINKSEFSLKGFEFLQNAEDPISSDDPLTETRVNPGDNESNFNQEIKKVFSFPKKVNKSCEALKKRVSSNSSFSRNLSSSFFRNGPNSSKSRSRSRVNV